jgi:transmembrane protein TMEM174 (potassium channel)
MSDVTSSPREREMWTCDCHQQRLAKSRRASSLVDESDADGSEERFARLSATSRVEAFSDGVFAVVMTLLILDLGVPDVAPAGLARGCWHSGRRTWPL